MKTISYASRTNRPINKSLEVFNSSLPSHSKTTCTSVVESIEYTSNIINENEDETAVNQNCETVLKADSSVAKSKTYEENVGSTKTKIPYQTRNNNTILKTIINIIAKPSTPILTISNVEKLIKNKRILIRSPLTASDTLLLLKADNPNHYTTVNGA